MPECPRCKQFVKSDAIVCNYCRTELKAFGHPGIPLYRAEKGEYLCQTCVYHEDDTCNYPQRPYAQTCTMYKDLSEPVEVEISKNNSPSALQGLLRFFGCK